MALIPMVIEESPRGERSFDIYSRLLRDRIVMINSEIEPRMAGTIIAQLLFLESENPNADISLYVQSPGGSVDAGEAIMDTMKYIKSPVSTIAVGSVASMGAMILASGEPGKRFALPNARIMIHQPSAGMQGKVTDMEIYFREAAKAKELLKKQLVEITGKTAKQIHDAMENDNWMTTEEAQKFGLIDEVLVKKS